MSDMIVLVLGALFGYASGWFQQYMDQLRRRKSVATALLAEQSRVHILLEYICNRWKGGRSVADFNIPMHESIPDIVELFKPRAVSQLSDYLGYLLVLQSALINLNETENKEYRKDLIKHIKERSQEVMVKGKVARHSLLDAGAIEIADPPSELYDSK